MAHHIGKVTTPLLFPSASGLENRKADRIPFVGGGRRWSSTPRKFVASSRLTKPMKTVLLIALAIAGLALLPVQHLDAQVFVRSGVEGLSFGFPGGYQAYPRYLNYYPYGYSLRPYVSYSQSYYYGPTHTRYSALTSARSHHGHHHHQNSHRH
jgi:hypothetical protein